MLIQDHLNCGDHYGCTVFSTSLTSILVSCRCNILTTAIAWIGHDWLNCCTIRAKRLRIKTQNARTHARTQTRAHARAPARTDTRTRTHIQHYIVYGNWKLYTIQCKLKWFSLLEGGIISTMLTAFRPVRHFVSLPLDLLNTWFAADRPANTPNAHCL